jgi:hypothetical protein
MIRKIINFFGFLLLILLLVGVYLSYFGLETKKFNKLIKDEISKKNDQISIELDKVKILLKAKDLSFNIETINPKVFYEKQEIKLKKISTNFSLSKFFSKKLFIDDLEISTQEIKIKDSLSILRNYSPSIQLFIIENMIKKGTIVADFNLNFDSQGKIKKDYQLNALIKNGSIKVLSKGYIDNINLKLNIQDKNYSLKDLDLNFDGLEFFSKSINIKKIDKNFIINGDIKNNNSKLKPEVLNLIFNSNFNNLKNINFNSETKFSFKLNKKFKVDNLKLKSDIILNSLKYNYDLPELKKFLPKFNKIIEFNKHTINLEYQKNLININGKGAFSINNGNEFIEYILKKKENDYLFKTKVKISDNPILFQFINYKKKDKINSELNLEGSIKDQNIILNSLSFSENKNKFFIKDLYLNKNLKINSFERIYLDFLNDKKKKNTITFKKNKKNYEINGKVFDASTLVENLLENNNSDGLSSILDSFNTDISIKIDKTFIDQTSYTNDLRGNIKIKNNEIKELDLISNFPNDRKITLRINTNKDNEKITTLFSNYPKPLVGQYKFIKGFEEGVLDFQSVKKGNISKSILNIDNFKVKEVPVLAKLLSLASLQGIADLLTGEGIRFTDFEMKFSNEGKLMKIDEIYAIGPAISIMMSGYIESKKLISLRGTLVPARTINRTIASIPLIGKVLVGKKTGEGVFGVSFKIKGPPKDLKTTVNPVKTLTPRFITRTLEKIKKN